MAERLLNMGPRSSAWLDAVGVRTLEDLQQLGVHECWLLLRRHGYPVTLNMLYALAGAQLGCNWRQLPPDVKQDLQNFARQHRHHD